MIAGFLLFYVLVYLTSKLPMPLPSFQRGHGFCCPVVFVDLNALRGVIICAHFYLRL